jgi:hypothetical protein
MIIEVDQDYDQHGRLVAIHTLDTDGLVVNPSGPGQITCQALLALINASSALRVQCGYDVISKHASYPAGTKRWNIVCQACSAATAPAALKALNLVQV